MSAYRTLFKLHGWLGISAGLVLAVMGATGATMAFDDEIMAALSPGVVTLVPATGSRLLPDALVAAAVRQRPGSRVSQIVIEADANRADRVIFAASPGKRRGEQSYVDPHDGRLLGSATGEGFFRTVEDLHRWLALPGGVDGGGRLITGLAAVSLVLFALSGLYLRWPRRPLDWRAWLVLDLRRGARNICRSLHRTIGGWLFLLYLFSALTGLWWSFDWYQRGIRYALIGDTAPAKKEAKPHAGPAPSLDPLWTSFLSSERTRFRRVTIVIPEGAGPVVMRELPWEARHDRMIDEFRFTAKPSEQVKIDRYAAHTAGQAIVGSFHPFHTGAFFGLPGRIALFISAATMPMFTITGLLLYFGRRSQRRHRAMMSRIS